MSYQSYNQEVGFEPRRNPNNIDLMQQRAEEERRSEQRYLEQMRDNDRVRGADGKNAQADVAALARLSSTMTD